MLDFVKAVNGKLLISVSNCEGDHPNNDPLDLKQTKKIFDFSHNYGVDIAAAEFMNEPNMLSISGAPNGYTASDYSRDLDIFNSWVKENYPDCLLAGPCALENIGENDVAKLGGGIGDLVSLCSTEDLMKDAKTDLDVYSYHYYNGISERLAAMLPEAHWNCDSAHTDEYLSVASSIAKTHTKLRDKYVPKGQMWGTESGDGLHIHCPCLACSDIFNVGKYKSKYNV